MSNDEVLFETEEIATGTYKQLQAKSFADLETNPKDWKMCEILHVNGNMVEYKIPQGFEHKQTDISKKLNIRIPGELSPQMHCELCGFPIKYAHFIQCDFKKLYLLVGSVCVNSFMGAKFVAKQIRHFKDNETRQHFKSWRETKLAHLQTKVMLWNGKPSIDFYTKKPRLQYWAWKISHKISTTDVETTTARKLKNLMDKADKIIENNGRNER